MSSKGSGWIGIGLSLSSGHVNSDMYVGWVDSAGNVIVLDTFSNAFIQPVYGSQQDATDVSGSLANGKVTITFTRLFNSNDAQDVR